MIQSAPARRYPDDFIAGHSPAWTLQLKIIQQAIANGALVKTSAIDVLTMLASTSQGLVTAVSSWPHRRRRTLVAGFNTGIDEAQRNTSWAFTAGAS